MILLVCCCFVFLLPPCFFKLDIQQCVCVNVSIPTGILPSDSALRLPKVSSSFSLLLHYLIHFSYTALAFRGKICKHADYPAAPVTGSGT